MIYIPLTTTPIGWLILGLGGYALYKRGRKKGEEEVSASQIVAVPAQLEEQTEGNPPKEQKNIKGGK
jgi:hypothetical protein